MDITCAARAVILLRELAKQKIHIYEPRPERVRKPAKNYTPPWKEPHEGVGAKGPLRAALSPFPPFGISRHSREMAAHRKVTPVGVLIQWENQQYSAELAAKSEE